MYPERTCTKFSSKVTRVPISIDLLLCCGCKNIAAPVHMEDITARLSEFFEEIDTPVHHPHHGVFRPWPPVTVTLRRLVTGQGKGRALVNKHDLFDLAFYSQMIGGGDTGNASSTDENFSTHTIP
jgi:hypothetical protein